MRGFEMVGLDRPVQGAGRGQKYPMMMVPVKAGLSPGDRTNVFLVEKAGDFKLPKGAVVIIRRPA
jgi:hypothetical protein